MKKILTIISAGLLFMSTSCNKSPMQDMQPANASDNSSSFSGRNTSPLTLSSAGLVTQMSVYYNNELLKVRAKQVTGASLPPSPISPGFILHTMYVIKAGPIPGTTVPRFDPILDVAPGIEFTSSAIWQEVIITFTNPLSKPYQFTSADEIISLLYRPNSFLSATKTSNYFEMEAPLMLQSAAAQ